MPRKPTRSLKRLPPAEDPFAAHEALDRAHLAAVFFDEHVARHPYVRAVICSRIAGDAEFSHGLTPKNRHPQPLRQTGVWQPIVRSSPNAADSRPDHQAQPE